MRLLAAGLACLVFACGCGKSDSTSGSGGSPSSGPSASKYGTPEATAKAFFAACAAADWKALGECCAPKDEGIAEIRDGKLSAKEKENFQKLLGAAKLGEATKGADGKTAAVKFTATSPSGKQKEGSLKMVLDGSDWKVVDLED